MKNKKGFIQIPLLIAIIAGVLVLGGGGYFGVKQYQNDQAEKVEQERVTQEQEKKTQVAAEARQKTLEEAQQQKDLAVEKLQQEVEALKKKDQSPKPKQYTISDLVSQSEKFAVVVYCFTNNGRVRGSGTVIGRWDGDLIVLTNYHIIEGAHAKYTQPGIAPCLVAESRTRSQTYYDAYWAEPFYPNSIPISSYESIDFALLKLTTSIPYTDGTILNHFSSLNSFPKVCDINSVKPGEEIAIFGFPGVGDISDTPNLTITEGIISGDVLPTDMYFVTSAKIEQGNSGGAAFLKESGCFIGMPTFVAVGDIESLGRLISLPKLKHDYLSKVFNNL